MLKGISRDQSKTKVLMKYWLPSLRHRVRITGNNGVVEVNVCSLWDIQYPKMRHINEDLVLLNMVGSKRIILSTYG